METSFKQTGIIHYDLLLTLRNPTLDLTLTISTESLTKVYRRTLHDDSLPALLKKEVGKVESVYFLLQKKENFEVDPSGGRVVLLMMKIESNYLTEERIELDLDFSGQEKQPKVESSEIFSEWGGEIEDLEFPEFDEERGSMKRDIKREMEIFKAQMEEWKKSLNEMKKGVQQTEKVKMTREEEYQGSIKDGKKDGFGILFFVRGLFKGDWYEGEWLNDQ